MKVIEKIETVRSESDEEGQSKKKIKIFHACIITGLFNISI
jgi:hypothetical protein